MSNQTLHDAVPNLRSTMAQLDLSQDVHPESLATPNVEDSDEKELANVLDKLLFPQVASIWSNNETGSPTGIPTPVKNSNIWAPIDNNDGDASSPATPNFSSYSSPLLREAINPELETGKETLNSSPDLFRETLSRPTSRDSSLPLGELKINVPAPSLSFLPKESRLRQIMSMNTGASHKPADELPFSFEAGMGQLTRQEMHNDFFPGTVSNNKLSVGGHQQVFAPENKYRAENNFQPNLPFAQAVQNNLPFGNPFHPLATGFQSQPVVRPVLHCASPRPVNLYQHQQTSPSFAPPSYNNQTRFPAQAFIQNASPVASLSSDSSDPINANDFPTLAETTAKVNSNGKTQVQPQQQVTKQQKQKQKSQGSQHQNGADGAATNGSNNNTSGNSTNTNNNNSAGEWVQVRKKKNKTKDSAPIPSGEEKIELLISMGFEKKKAIRALQNTNRNLDEAIEWLLRKASQNGECH